MNEREKAIRSSKLYGVGFLVNGEHVEADRIAIFYNEPNTPHQRIKALVKEIRGIVKDAPYPENAFWMDCIKTLEAAEGAAFHAFCCGLKVEPVFDSPVGQR